MLAAAKSRGYACAMNPAYAPMLTPLRFDVRDLQEVVESARLADAVPLRLSEAQWAVLGASMQGFDLAHGHVLIRQGARDQALYFVEQGKLTVHLEDSSGQILLATVGPGSVVGEGAFFSHGPRSATAQAAADCRLWRLSPDSWAELAREQPALALQVVTALACVMARRMAHQTRRVAVT